MTLEELNNWNLSEYNEGDDDQLDYYFQERNCEIGSTAYMFSHEDNELMEMEIVNYIIRSNNSDEYDTYDEDVLLDGEDKYDADTSCEFITDHDCYLVWFKFK